VEAEQEEIRYQVKNEHAMIGETFYRSVTVKRLHMDHSIKLIVCQVFYDFFSPFFSSKIEGLIYSKDECLR
jgi:hypothetical protein